VTIEGITEDDIANYLAQTPGFFERHAELLSSIQLTSPHGQRAVSLQERQMEMLRDRIRAQEHKIVEMLRHGQDNVVIADRLHRWTCAMMLTTDARALPAAAVQELQRQFMVPMAALRLWDLGPEVADEWFAGPVSDDLRTFTASLVQPYCGANAGFEAAAWLDAPTAAVSMALIPLRPRSGDEPFGLLVLGSPDPTRFGADMGTDFLARVGEIAGAALSRLRA
jgi:uncharacterized protein YigA (DUF484 family)